MVDRLDREMIINNLCFISDYKMPLREFRIIRDAVDLLKRDAPRVLSWDEVKDYSVVWVEFKGIFNLYPMIITVDSDGEVTSWNPRVNRSGDFMLLVGNEEDRKNTRCWSREPTYEQRNKTKWEERLMNKDG